jgi:nucleotidyltransferase/DNA polymerase involved in DNA repair
VTKAPVISHQIEKIEGIGKSIGNFLRSIGIKTTTDLLDKCSTDSGFQQVVKVSEVVEPVVKQWVVRADLMRVPDVDGQYAELMEVSGIMSVQDLANADAEELTEKMRTVNQREHCIPGSIPLPDVNQIRHWIKDANTLP